MRRKTSLALACLVSLGILAPRLEAQRANLASVSWLNGCWEARNATRAIIERWEVAGNELKGQSRTIANGTPREPERLKIFIAADSLVYGAEPPGQRYAEFRATLVSPQEVVFENPAHDFPKRIAYRLTTKDSLHARVDGGAANPTGTARTLNYPYARVACTPDTPTRGEVVSDELASRYADLDAKEIAAGSGTNAWMAEHALPGFQLVTWIATGRTAPVATAEVLARAVEASRSNPAVAAIRDRVHTLRIERLSIQGDTAAVLVTVNRTQKFPDNAGNFGSAGAYHESRGVQRRIDKWMKLDGAWKLRESAVVGTELYIDGRLTSRDGVTLPRP